MLIVDLGRLGRERRLRLEKVIGPEDPLWNGLDFRFAGPLRVELEAQTVEHDVLVRGRVVGELEYECRRCLEPVTRRLDEDISMFYRSGVAEEDAEAEEVYALPERGDLDLGPALREQVALAVPGYALCREDCRGLCPQCGTNRNQSDCDCEVEHGDDRWAALRRINFE